MKNTNTNADLNTNTNTYRDIKTYINTNHDIKTYINTNLDINGSSRNPLFQLYSYWVCCTLDMNAFVLNIA